MKEFKLQPTESDAAMIQQDADNFRELVNARTMQGLGVATKEHNDVVDSFEKLVAMRVNMMVGGS